MAWCKDCQAGIEWHLTDAGKNMPIDPLPRPDGDYRFGRSLRLVRATREERRQVHAAAAAGNDLPLRLYKCHFDTCTKRRRTP